MRRPAACRRCSAAGSSRCRRCSSRCPARSRPGRRWPPAGRRRRRRCGIGRAEDLGVGLAVDLARRAHRRAASRRGTPRISQQLVVPVQRVDVEQQRAAGVADVGDVHAAAGEPPDEERVDGAEQHLAALARARAGRGCVSSRWVILVPEKYASTTRPVLRRIVASCPSAFRRSQIGALTRLCQTMALATGLPVWRSHRMVVSRWFVMPIAAMSAGPRARPAAAPPRATSSCDDQIASGSCSTSPGRGKICGNSCCAVATTRPSWPNTIARLDVVPWSRARTKRALMPPPAAPPPPDGGSR